MLNSIVTVGVLCCLLTPSVLARTLDIPSDPSQSLSSSVIAARDDTVYLEIDGIDGEQLTIQVPADSDKHPVSELECTDRSTGEVEGGCSTIKVMYLPAFSSGYCCNIDWNQCYKQGDILGGGFAVDPAQSMDLVRCQPMTDGVCGAWKESKLHNKCK